MRDVSKYINLVYIYADRLSEVQAICTDDGLPKVVCQLENKYRWCDYCMHNNYCSIYRGNCQNLKDYYLVVTREMNKLIEYKS